MIQDVTIEERMPRIDCDKRLQDRLVKVVQAVGNPSAVATKLGLPRTLVWRFYKRGCAIPRSRERLEAALDAYDRQGVSNIVSETENDTKASLLQLAALSPEEFRTMRKYFQSMVAMMDLFEKSRLYPFDQAPAVSSAGNDQ